MTTMTLHPIADVARHIPGMANPERWLSEQIRSRRIRARKIGRRWFMTDDDITAALEVFANITDPAPTVETPAPTPTVQPSAASMRLRMSAAS